VLIAAAGPSQGRAGRCTRAGVWSRWPAWAGRIGSEPAVWARAVQSGAEAGAAQLGGICAGRALARHGRKKQRGFPRCCCVAWLVGKAIVEPLSIAVDQPTELLCRRRMGSAWHRCDRFVSLLARGCIKRGQTTSCSPACAAPHITTPCTRSLGAGDERPRPRSCAAFAPLPVAINAALTLPARAAVHHLSRPFAVCGLPRPART
jgi:hypothetical protein